MSTYLDRVRHQVLLPGTDQYLTLSLTEKISPQFYIFTNIRLIFTLTCSLWNYIKSDYLSIFYANVFEALLLLESLFCRTQFLVFLMD